jgi:type I restriction enzyme S subunit
MSDTSILTVHNPAGGQLPEGWRVGPLNEFCEMYQPKTISTKELIDHGEFPVYGANGQIGFYDQFNHADSEVTVTCRGATCGTVNVIPARSWITGNAMVVRPLHGSVSRPFLAYELQSIDMTAVITGTAQPQITRTTLAPMSITVPPLAEQEKIVEILEEQLSRLGAALESVRVVREKAAQFRRSLLHAAFTGTLTGHNPANGQLPEGWVAEPLGSIAKISTGKTPSKFERRLEDSPRSDRTIPFFKVGDMNSADRYLFESRVYFADDEADFFRLEILEVGTIIFPKAGGAIATNKKRVLNVRGAIDLNCMAVTATNAVMSELIYWFFESFDLLTIADGSVLPQIGKRRVAEILIQFPESPHRQSELVEVLEEQLSRLDAALAVADAIEKRSAALRRSLLHAAFTGRLTEKWRESVHV